MTTNRLTAIMNRQRRHIITDSLFYLGLAVFTAILSSPMF